MKILCMDLGGSRAKLAVMEDGQILSLDIFAIDAARSMADTLIILETHARQLAGFAECAAIGFAYPGIVNRKECRVVTSCGKYTDAMNVDYLAWARSRFGLPLTLINDAAAAICGEMAYGVGRGYEDAVLMMVGTGIGTAVISEGKLLEGKHSTMGILGGHIAVAYENPRRCVCGNLGCLEAYAGSWALDGLAREDAGFSKSMLSRAPQIDYRALIEGCRAGDALSRRLFASACSALGTGAVNLIHAYDPEVLILSGGGSHIDELQTAIQEHIRTYSWPPCRNVKVLRAENPEVSVLLGLNALADRL